MLDLLSICGRNDLGGSAARLAASQVLRLNGDVERYSHVMTS